MEKYKVIRAFNDSTKKGKKYSVGDIYECDEKRATVLKGKNKYGNIYIADMEKEKKNDDIVKTEEKEERPNKKRGLSLD